MSGVLSMKKFSSGMSVLACVSLLCFVPYGCVTGSQNGTATDGSIMSTDGGGQALRSEDLSGSLEDDVVSVRSKNEASAPAAIEVNAPYEGGSLDPSLYYLPEAQSADLKRRALDARDKLKRNGRDASSLKALAYEALAEGNGEGAVTFVNLAKKGRAMDDEMNVILGVAAVLRGESSKGFGYFSAAESLNPRNVVPIMNRGLLALSKGAGRDAVMHFSKVLDISPGLEAAQLHLGRAYVLAKDFKKAEKTYQALLSKYPFNGVARFNLGQVYHTGLRNPSKAKAQFKRIADDARQSPKLRAEAEGAYSNILREEHGKENLATMGVY